MEMDILAILMVAFGLFAVLMFILFYAYAKKYYNEKHLDNNFDEDEIAVYLDEKEQVESENEKNNLQEFDEEFIPRKRK